MQSFIENKICPCCHESILILESRVSSKNEKSSHVNHMTSHIGNKSCDFVYSEKIKDDEVIVTWYTFSGARIMTVKDESIIQLPNESPEKVTGTIPMFFNIEDLTDFVRNIKMLS